MVGVARSGREPGACAGARQRDTRGGGRGAGSCLQPGQLSPAQHTGSSSSWGKLNHLRDVAHVRIDGSQKDSSLFVAKMLSNF